MGMSDWGFLGRQRRSGLAAADGSPVHLRAPLPASSKKREAHARGSDLVSRLSGPLARSNRGGGTTTRRISRGGHRRRRPVSCRRRQRQTSSGRCAFSGSTPGLDKGTAAAIICSVGHGCGPGLIPSRRLLLCFCERLDGEAPVLRQTSPDFCILASSNR